LLRHCHKCVNFFRFDYSSFELVTVGSREDGIGLTHINRNVIVCHVMLRYVILCVQQFLRLTPGRTREKPNVKGCCNKGFNNLTGNYTFHLFREKFSAGQKLFNEREFMCAITSRCEREYNLSLNLLVAMEKKTRRIYTLLYLQDTVEIQPSNRT